MKKLLTLVLSAALTLCLLLGFTDTAYAGDLDLIRQYDVVVTPNAEDGSLDIEVAFQWEVLEQGPVIWLQIGIPNGSIRDEMPLTDNIDSLEFDNSYMYVYFNRGYNDGEVIEFSYRWTQEYMYALGDGTVVYDYTPGWFDEARIEKMSLTWNAPQEVGAPEFHVVTTGGQWEEHNEGSNSAVYTGRDLSHGAQINVSAVYLSWPTELLWEGSRDNLPSGDFYYGDDFYYDDPDFDASAAIGSFLVILLIVLYIVIRILLAADGYAGGFGTRYVFYHGLWYPAGRDGRPRPGSVGMHKKPQPPRSSGGGFGGGSRGGFGGGSRGGFGGGSRGGFGGGGHCACASSCACACACACAGGGRAGCSAKNLYGSVQLSQKLTEQLKNQ